MKARCHECFYLNWYYLTGEYWAGDWFCGLHGSATVNPDGNQPDFDHKGGCGFHPIQGTRQMTIPPWMLN